MEASIFLAQLIGPVMLAMGLFVAFNPERISRVGREVLDSDALLMISGAITLPAGLAIVLTHNLWLADWRVLITLIGWIMVVAGVARLMLPGFMQRIGASMLDRPLVTGVPGALMALIGAYLAYRGFSG